MRILWGMLQWLLLYVMVIVATAEPNVEILEFPSNSYGDQFTNMAVFDGKVYVGAKNYILALNATDLSQVQRVRTCAASTDCNNKNMVLLVNEKLNQLITCGTGNDGICEIRLLSDTGNVLSSGSSSIGSASIGSSDLAVSSNESRPVTFVLNKTTNGLYTGVTYGPGSYNLYMANYSLSDNRFTEEAYLKLDTDKVSNNDYIVYYKAGFSLNGFIYFFTNQKYEAGDKFSLTSKIIRICQSDGKSGEPTNSFWSYTDIPLECRKDGKVYDLVQDVTIFKPGKQLLKEMNVTAEDWIIAATFTSGSRPDESAVCLYKLSDIDQHIMTAKRDFITCQANHFNGSRYLRDERGIVCVNSTDYDQNVIQKVPCNTLFDTFRYVIGGTATKMFSQAVYTSNSPLHGVFGKIKAKSIGEYTVVYVGTSKGQLIMLNVNSEEATVYEENEVDGGHPITALHLEDGGKIYYAMSDRKLVRYESISCNEYTTCEATMEARNPLCGWCVYQNRTTFKDNSSCPYQLSTGHWLSSLTQCLKLDVNLKGLAVPGTYRVNAFFTGVTPDLISGYEYGCEIRAGPQSHQVFTNFTCKTPQVDAHTEGEVLLYVKTPSNNTVLLAQTDLLFYDCGHYKICGECLRDPRANCSWNSHTTKCVPRNDSLDIFIQKNGTCSSFQNNEDRLYLPSGVQKILIFNVTNLVNTSVSMNYSCKLNGKVFSAQRLSDSKINCTLQETTTENEAEYKLEILYGTSALDGKNTVVVYNCSKLGSDCSICRSLKYGNPNYVCDWCSGDCVHYESPCSLACGPPNVTGILPNTAGLDGNITVTIYGQEMGSHFDDVDNITLAGIACEPQREDFMPSTRVTCKAGRSGNVKGGNVTMVVNNQTSREYVRFEYKMPTVETVLPTKGPQKGGTRLTIRGQDLGIGTRMVKVNVTIGTGVNSETKECTDAEVMPKLSLNNMSNFHIECDTPASAAVDSNIEKATVIFDGGTENEEVMNFTYKENPEMDDRDLKNIASGGINQTITGKKFGNANKGFVSMKCQNETKTQSCIIKSDTEMICEVPELCDERKNELINKSRRKRETGGSGVVNVEIIIHLDGVQQTFSIFYYSDPSFNPFDEDSKVKLFESKNKKLTIRGSNLNLVAGEDDVIVTIGVGNCDVIELRETNLTCVAPTNQPAPGVPGANFPEVNVTIGNVHGNLGYLQYVEIQEEQAKQWIIIFAVISSLLAVVVIILVAFLVKYKRKLQYISNSATHENHIYIT